MALLLFAQLPPANTIVQRTGGLSIIVPVAWELSSSFALLRPRSVDAADVQIDDDLFEEEEELRGGPGGGDDNDDDDDNNDDDSRRAPPPESETPASPPASANGGAPSGNGFTPSGSGTPSSNGRASRSASKRKREDQVCVEQSGRSTGLKNFNLYLVAPLQVMQMRREICLRLSRLYWADMWSERRGKGLHFWSQRGCSGLLPRPKSRSRKLHQSCQDLFSAGRFHKGIRL